MKRDDAGAIAIGAVVGAALALMAILIWTEVSRPASFPTTTVAALPTPFAIPTPTPRPTVPLTLTPDGLGLVSFGQPGEATADQLKAILGSPTSDDRWTCTEPAADVHFVQWAELGVFLIDNVFVGYVDAIYYPPQFGPLLGLETEDGVGIGLDLEDLQTRYGDRLRLLEPDGEFDADHQKFVLDGEGGIWGVVERGPDGSRVITISAGTTCFDNGP
jgi:hypothetical protein